MIKIFHKSFILLIFISIISCSIKKDPAKYGKLSGYDPSGVNKNFIFTVTEQYVRKHKKSPPSSKNPVISKAEEDILERLLHRHNVCINDYHNPIYKITSKQEKIYDVTFAGLIQENYNARPIVPRRYYGVCTNEHKALEPDYRKW